MSSSIWTRCAGDSEIRELRVDPWRAVEAQHQLSTRKLVSSADEQMVLEELIDSAKPPDVTGGRRHYLLSTPFRDPPLRHGTRFGTRLERGIWYGSETRETAFSEVAYYRFVFREGTRADLGVISTPLTVFRTKARSDRGVDLTIPPFDAYRRTIASRMRYDASQALGAAMRTAGVELFRYHSARDPKGGVNVGAFTPEVFGRARPRDLETWQCVSTPEMVEFTKRDYFGREVLTFGRELFVVDGKLPAPAV
jgi:hypothetical protein